MFLMKKIYEEKSSEIEILRIKKISDVKNNFLIFLKREFLHAPG